MILINPPSNLLVDPCQAVEAGETVSTLAQGYVTNTGCIHKYQKRMQTLREWSQEQSVIYNNKDNKE